MHLFSEMKSGNSMPKIKNIHLLAHINEIPWEEAQLLFLQPGNKIGPENRYEIVSLLGTGSIGVVYLVKDLENHDNLLALKMILPYIFEDDHSLEIFLDKVTEVQKIRQASILPIYDFWKQNNLYFYSMEYVAGLSLEEWIEEYLHFKRCIPLPEVCKMILQICQGLLMLHKISGHYLLHPNNILLKKEGKEYEAKISDFGLYYLRGGKFWCRASSLMGRDSYLLIHEKEKEYQPEPQSDIFSLVMLLHKILFFTTRIPLKKQWPENRQDIPFSLYSLFDDAFGKREKDWTLEAIQEILEEILLEYRDCELSTSKKDWTYKEEDTKKRLVLKEALPSLQPHRKLSLEYPQMKEVAFVKDGEYNKLLLQARNRLDQKKYPEAIELLTQAFAIQETSIVSELLENANNLFKRALECKEEGIKKEQEDIQHAIALVCMSLEIYPHDKDAQKILKDLKEKQELEHELSEVLKEGDQLAEKMQYEEAIHVWQKKAGNTPLHKELQDRVIQVLDIMSEEVRELLEKGFLEEAQKKLACILKYSQESYYKELQKEISEAIEKKEKTLNKVYELAEKHLQKKQFGAALEVWKSQLQKMPQERGIQKKFLETQKLLSLSQENEIEYSSLIKTAQKLEQREDYKGALNAMEKVRKRRDEWVYSTPDPTAEIERLKKMVISMEYSAKAQNILIEIRNILHKKQWRDAEDLLSDPVFQLPLIPSVHKSYQNICLQLEEQHKKWQIISEIAKIALAAIVLVIFMTIYFYFLKK